MTGSVIDFFRHGGAIEEHVRQKEESFFRRLLEMGLVLTVMSIDTVIAVLGIAANLPSALFILLFSAVVRLLFVRQMAIYIKNYPAVNIVILTFLILIGLELIIQGLGIDYEGTFNAILLISIIVAFIYHRQRSKSITIPTKETLEEYYEQ